MLCYAMDHVTTEGIPNIEYRNEKPLTRSVPLPVPLWDSRYPLDSIPIYLHISISLYLHILSIIKVPKNPFKFVILISVTRELTTSNNLQSWNQQRKNLWSRQKIITCLFSNSSTNSHLYQEFQNFKAMTPHHTIKKRRACSKRSRDLLVSLYNHWWNYSLSKQIDKIDTILSFDISEQDRGVYPWGWGCYEATGAVNAGFLVLVSGFGFWVFYSIVSLYVLCVLLYFSWVLVFVFLFILFLSTRIKTRENRSV